jgi:hypothetical protein
MCSINYVDYCASVKYGPPFLCGFRPVKCFQRPIVHLCSRTQITILEYKFRFLDYQKPTQKSDLYQSAGRPMINSSETSRGCWRRPRASAPASSYCSAERATSAQLIRTVTGSVALRGRTKFRLPDAGAFAVPRQTSWFARSTAIK